MNRRLYVGNLALHTTEDEIKSLFERCGAVTSVKIITDHISGLSRGFAFVEMETEDSAQSAIASLNRQALNDKEIHVSEARPPRARGGP